MRALLAILCVLVAAGVANAQTVTVVLNPVADNTLYEHPAGALSNGAGQRVFAGNPNGAPGTIRRALMRWDLAAAIPAGATITSVTLTVNLSNPDGGGASTTCTIHPVNASWGEGASVGFSGEGGGGFSAPGDATWIHRFHPDVFWNAPGGDFGASIGSLVITGNGPKTFASTPAMVASAQAWLDDPCHAFGWLIDGNGGDAKRMDARENAVVANRPKLTVQYVPGTVTKKFVGNDPGLAIDVLVNGCPSGNGSGVHPVRSDLGDVVTLDFRSPGGVHDGKTFFAGVQVFPASLTTVDPGGPPAFILPGGTPLHVQIANLGAMVVLVDSLSGSSPLPAVIAPYADANFIVPPFLAGTSLVVNCLITDFTIPDLIRVADAQELLIQP